VEQPSAVETPPLVPVDRDKPKQEPFPAAPHQAPPVGGQVALRRYKRERLEAPEQSPTH